MWRNCATQYLTAHTWYNMSTDSGEPGFCIYCGHFLSAHTKERHAKCKKCKKRILICQAGVHATGAGWKICHLPCSCGEGYYPSNAKAARLLQPTEYAETHPDYEFPSYADDYNTSHEPIAEPVYSAVSTYTEPVYVDVFESDDTLWFYGCDNEVMWTQRDDWRSTTKWYEGANRPCFQFDNNSTGLSYFTWNLGPGDAAAATQSAPVKGSKHGTTGARGGSSRRGHTQSHGRTLSEESIDPLQWDQATFEAETLASQMASLSVIEGSSSQTTDRPNQAAEFVEVSARHSGKGMVSFRPHSGPREGKKLTSRKENWNKNRGGYVFDSEAAGCVFFAKEIKPAKK